MVVLCFSILRVALQSEPSFSESEAVYLLKSSERCLPTSRFSVVHRLLYILLSEGYLVLCQVVLALIFCTIRFLMCEGIV